jgi:GPI inositol-deacylase
MRRRSSGSSAEDVEDDSAPPAVAVDTTLVSFPDSVRGKLKSKSDEFAKLQQQSTPAAKDTTQELDRRKSTEKRSVTARSRRPSNTNWKPVEARNGSLEPNTVLQSTVITVPPVEGTAVDKMPDSRLHARRSRFRNPWATSLLTLVTTALAVLSIVLISHSFLTRQLDPKGCRMSYMRPSFAKLKDFDTEHTRFASKYSVYLYREEMVDEDTKVHAVMRSCCTVANKFYYRSKAFLFSLYQGTRVATSKFVPLQQKLLHTFTISFNMTRR